MIKLTATNYIFWRSRMEDFLICKDLFEPLEAKGRNPDPNKAVEWKKLNRKIIDEIRQWIDDSIFYHIEQETDAYALWKKLEDMYKDKTAYSKVLLMRRLVDLKLRSRTSVAKHISEFQSLVNQLSVLGLQLDDEKQALLLLSSLQDSWETLAVVLSNSAPNDKLTMLMVKDALFNEEARRKDAGMDQSHAFVTVRRRQQGGNQGKGRVKNESIGGFTKGKKLYKCYHCGLEGHLKKNCRKLLREQ
ncbi:retrovirus-related Pol polyprotein from transposon TNT 1-94 [Ziziphus jujuba]|uniref:Retrovirus-related Pol polyprotein from transposon TNT 1-94 n=1 Tax=Ziziphus jujuba TaxID=326968 RepID=A0A6P3Z5Y1_ZIZJJ|nr:retrovirus-related Pol polyprotein from transposon TNT 1-94 [Ziziphus jujuba]